MADLREAVDFLRYYAELARAQFAGPMTLPGPTGERNQLSLAGRGVFACISPWNFPLAIFTGQVAAALAAGNAVIAKPAEQTPLIAFQAVSLLHRAGIPGDVLALLPGDGARIGRQLLSDPRINGVAFTGSNETANLINRALAERRGPIIPLIAETGGMNAMIVDSSALPEQAIRDVLSSAFDSAGQRCSAARILFVQEDIADRVIPDARRRHARAHRRRSARLRDRCRARSSTRRRGWRSRRTRRGCARGQRTIAELTLAPECDRGTFVAPAAFELPRLDILEREVFGPVLHVIRYRGDRLAEVCDAINRSGYGLTLGIHTRIESTVEEVRSRVRVGNIYVNRNQIGAVVGAQPFGGEGSVGHRTQGRGATLSLSFRHRAGGVGRHHRLGRQCSIDVDGGRWRPLACQLSNSLRIIFSARLRVLIYIPVVIFEVDVDGG